VAVSGRRADELMREALRVIDDVRAEVALGLEHVPTEAPKRHLWFRLTDHERGWAWRDVCGETVRRRAVWSTPGLVRLGDLVKIAEHRPKTVVPRKPQLVLEWCDVRSDGYLAIPDYTRPPRPVERQHDSPERRFYEVDEPCLLVPLVGDVEAAPVLLAPPWLEPEAGPLAVPGRWLPLRGLRWPRTLAVMLDQPFVRLQRRLAAVLSTPTHLTYEAIERLLLPELPADLASRCEQRLRAAQEQLAEAHGLASAALCTAEEWYA
jgi:hypothetical protein